MPYSPSAKAIALQQLIAANLANAGSPGPWPAMQNGTTPALPTQAVIDGILGATGYQVQNTAAASAFTTSSTSFTPCTGFSSWSFNAPVAATYLFHVDLFCFCSTLPAADTIYFRLNVGLNSYALPHMNMAFYAVNQQQALHMIVPAVVPAGSNTVFLDVHVGSAATVFATNTSSWRCYTVEG